MTLLRIFPAYRELEDKLRSEGESRTLLQDRVNELTARCEALQAEIAETREKAIDDLRRSVDFFSVSCSGRPVFGPIPPGAEPPKAGEPVARAPQGRDLVRQGYARLQDDLRDIDSRYEAELKARQERAAS